MGTHQQKAFSGRQPEGTYPAGRPRAGDDTVTQHRLSYENRQTYGNPNDVTPEDGFQPGKNLDSVALGRFYFLRNSLTVAARFAVRHTRGGSDNRFYAYVPSGGSVASS
jgi:hypothetical protein